jgi:hypothetical protein
MSQETWRAEFYPIEASRVPSEDAVAHSLQKWRGLTKANLRKHRLSESPILVDGSTCAMCQCFYNPLLSVSGSGCSECPGKAANGRACDTAYDTWSYSDDTRPMLRWLKRAAAHEALQANNKPKPKSRKV